MQRLAKLEKTVDQLMQPKSTARVMANQGTLWYWGEITSVWSSKVADVDLYDLELNDLSRNVEVTDPKEVFATLGVGDWIEVKYVNGKHYTNQAPCAGA